MTTEVEITVQGDETDLNPAESTVLVQELKNLLWLQPGQHETVKEEQKLLVVAFQDWSQQVSALTDRVDNQKRDLRSATNEIYLLVGFYSALQGLLFASAAQASSLHCKNWPIPIALSFLATVFILFTVWENFKSIRRLKEDYRQHQRERNNYKKLLNRLRNEGAKFEFRKGPEASANQDQVYQNQELYTILSAVGVFSIAIWIGIACLMCNGR